MANLLDEMDTSTHVGPEGKDVNVIQKQLPVKVGVGSKVFEIILWVLAIIPGLIFLVMKIKAGNYFRSLEQKIQHDASQIDNYLEQRVLILQNCAKLLDKAIDLDKTTFTQIAEYRGGSSKDDNNRNKLAGELENVRNKIQVAFENYPDLKAHDAIEKALKENEYLQKEITAARELYNDSVAMWNMQIMQWPAKMIVAAKNGYTTRIPFATTKEIKEQARGTFF
ncbi:MAG: LemA family protein [Clostridiales bacterium]|nr:LemA family protein [Clostridiales bacterium]